MQLSEIKQQFPIFEHHPDLVYLDNSATTHKPRQVIEAITDYYEKYNSNIHRGFYPIAVQATDAYELARLSVAKLLNCKPEQIVFTSGATAALNGLARSLSNCDLLPSEPIIHTTDSEHHSNVVPWQQIPGAQVEYIGVNENFELDYSPEQMQAPDVLSFSLVSNVTGAIAAANGMINSARKLNPSVIAIIDASQAAGHILIDPKDLGADFVVFAGHKMYGPTGIGALWGKADLLEQLPPFDFGGGMIREVKRDGSDWAPVPAKFEAGTPNIAGAIGMGAAADFIAQVGLSEIRRHEIELSEYASEQLQRVPGIKVFHPKEITEHAGVFSFVIEGTHPHDVAQILGDSNVAIRAGHHCAQVLHRDVLGVPATNRMSLAIYNTSADVDALVAALHSAIKILI